MNNSESVFKDLNSCKLETYPFNHVVVDDYIKDDFLSLLLNELVLLESLSPQKIFESDFGSKREWKFFPKEFKHLNRFLSHMSSKEILGQIKSLFNIQEDTEIYPDLSYDGGGYVISPPKSYLSYHADFNYSNILKKYRSFNILFYVNEEFFGKGGCLHLLDPVSKTVEKIVEPKLNRILLFATDDISFHGVTRNADKFSRRSFNFYYYTTKPLSKYQNLDPHKTIWLDFNHEH